jgi:prepilin-type N-terminal cleavage/methylation domain-containing protein
MMSATGDRREAGFTLLESLTVLAITGAIAGLVYPSFERTMDSAALAKTAAALQSDLRRARGLALASGGPDRLAIAPDGQGYGWSDGRSVRWAGAVRLASAQPIAFYADGSASPGTLLLAAGRRSAAIGVTSSGVVTGAPSAQGRS